MANENDTGYDPREFEEVGGKPPAPRPSAEFMADPDVKRQMDFNDFINTPEGEKWVLDLMRKLSDPDLPTHPGPAEADAKFEAERARHGAKVEENRTLDEYMRNPGPIEGRLTAARDMAGVVGRTLMEPSFMPVELAQKNFMAAQNRSDLRNKTEDVSRKVLADEQTKLAPQYDKPMATDTE